jgi:hypothetical protein
LLLLQLTTYNKSFAEKGERGERDKGNKNRGRGMEIHKPRERKKKGISERGNNIARLGSVLHETSGREKGKKKGRNRNEEEADDSRRNRNHSRRGGEANKETEEEKGTGEGRSAEWSMEYGTEGIIQKFVEITNGVWRGEGFPVDWREGVICAIYKKG